MIARSWAFACRMVLLLAVMAATLGVVILVQRYPYVVLLGLGMAIWIGRGRREPPGWSHGTARMGNVSDLARGGMLCETGITLGTADLMARPTRWRSVLELFSPFSSSEQACRAFFAAILGPRWNADRFIRISKFCHVATFAKTGGGKGVSLFVPNLLSYGRSVVVVDIKAELWKLTAEHRQKRLKHKVFRLDPTGIAGPVESSSMLNPLDFIQEESDDFLDQCRELAHQLAVKTGKEHDEHWVDSAILVLTAFIAFVCGCEADRSKRNLITVRKFVSSRICFANAVAVMQQQPEACQGVIAQLGHMLSWYVDRELGSVLSTVQRFTEFLDSPAVQKNVSSSSFDPRILRTGRASLYLCLAHDKVTSLAPLQRMWLSTIMRVVAKDQTGERDCVLFMIDEAAHLGRIEAIENALTLLRGMGIRIWLAFQSLDQVKTVFGDKATTILDNIGTKQFFAINSWESAEAISKQIGETTIRVKSFNRSTSRSRPTGSNFGQNANQPGNFSTSTSFTSSEAARRLIRAEEILGFDEDVSLVFHNNLPVAAARLIRYYDHPAYIRGRTGKPRRLGLLAGLAAVSFLVLGIALASIASSLPVPVLRRHVSIPAPAPPSAFGRPRHTAPFPGQGLQPRRTTRQARRA